MVFFRNLTPESQDVIFVNSGLDETSAETSRCTGRGAAFAPVRAATDFLSNLPIQCTLELTAVAELAHQQDKGSYDGGGQHQDEGVGVEGEAGVNTDTVMVVKCYFVLPGHK